MSNRNRSITWRFCLAVLILLIGSFNLYPQSKEPERDFDFWLGEWDVKLRVLQADNSWLDKHKAVAKIYPILGGKAVLELWSEGKEGINGYSLRYFNPAEGKWDLWLNWAGKNRSGTNGLKGVFRHGRGEFFAQQKMGAETTRISRYTFSDITDSKLRWDDGYSTDGGKTWSSNWIMEFSRKAATTSAFGSEKNLHTYFDGSRCDLPQYAVLKDIVRNWEQNEWLTLHNILDGCIVAGFARTPPASKWKHYFFTLTWNTYANVYEFGLIDDRRENPLVLYYGGVTTDDNGTSSIDFKAGSGDKGKLVISEKGNLLSLDLEYSGAKLSLGFGTLH